MKRTVTALFTITLLFISYRSLTNAAGPPSSMSNAPGDGNCTSCHTGSALQTSGTAWTNMSLSVVGGTLATLVKNTTYTFNLTFANSPRIKYGFQLCVLQAGAVAATPSLGTLVSTTAATQIVSGGTRNYLEHTSSGTSAPGSTKTWTFQWTTPVSYTGGATFYVIVNSTNNDANLTGDIIYAKTFAATIALPVSWLYTKTESDKDGVLINWATASEENNWKFEVEKSLDQKEWSVIGEVKGMGNSSMVNRYSFRDDKTNGTNYYRVKQIDFNGEYSYSDITSAESEAKKEEPSIRYNEDKRGFIVYGEGIKNLSITDMKGEVKYASYEYAEGQLLPALGSGMYLVRIQTTTSIYYQKILMH